MMRKITVFFLILAGGCSGAAQTPAVAPFNGAGSWIRHTSGSSPLIYASDEENVLIYDYSGNKVGELSGFGNAGGLCTDANGDVFVPDRGRELIYEYQGGSLPVDVIDDRPEAPESCAVDPTTGNLAVVNYTNVEIFSPGTSGSPVAYTAPNIQDYAYGAYDSSGNLYVDGTTSKHGMAFAALDKGSQKFVAVPLSGIGNRDHRAAGVQWDGQYVAVGDSLAGSIYRVAVSGSSGTIVQTIKVRGWFGHYPIDFAIAGKKLLFPLSDKLLFFAYPKGGKRTGGFLGSVGLAVTVVPYQY